MIGTGDGGFPVSECGLVGRGGWVRRGSSFSGRRHKRLIGAAGGNERRVMAKGRRGGCQGDRRRLTTNSP